MPKTRVLEERQLLDSERKQWKTQATHSFQNKFTRSMSRTRSKSLTQKGRRIDDLLPSSMEFLAARVCLGNQVVTPTISPFVPAALSGENASKLPKARSYGHLRSDRDGLEPSPQSRSNFVTSHTASSRGNLEHALRCEDTKVIRLADPAVTAGKGLSEAGSSEARTSLTSDVRIGIAIGTPPLVQALDVAEDPVRTRMLVHPYAQGGLYSGGEYGGRVKGGVDGDDGAVRERLVPRMSSHPYAQQRYSYVSSERIIPYPREDSDVPPAAKMWALWSPGRVAREVLPQELMYSPRIPPAEGEQGRGSAVILDTVGVGEALVYGVGLAAGEGGGGVQRAFRQPVQYDATRPVYMSHGAKQGGAGSGTAGEWVKPQARARGQPLELLPSTLPSGVDDLARERESRNTSPESPSPPLSPRPFDNPDNLDSFYDLFYQPPPRGRREGSRSGWSGSEVSLAGSMRVRRAGSGLSSLVRQLSASMDEIMMVGGEGEEHIRRSGSLSLSLRRGESPGRRFGRSLRQGTDSTLEFVFEESLVGEGDGPFRPGRSDALSMSPFQASSEKIPEDVESSSSLIGGEEDETGGFFRFGWTCGCADFFS